jgi:GNAT superfamily N-acetyltransferase
MPAWTVHTHRRRPDLEAQLDTFQDIWPQFIYHDATAAEHYHHTTTTFAEFNLYVCDAEGLVVATGLALPLVWDGHIESLPGGWDDSLVRGVSDFQHGRQPTALSALGIMVRRDHQGHGLSARVLDALKQSALNHGLNHLIAPVRPTLKCRYPLTPMDHYVTWRQDDGSHFDPWIRVHEREGATLLCIAERSMLIQGIVADWEKWTGMRLPDTGSYIIPGALNPIEIDREHDLGTYYEPNVWMVHQLATTSSSLSPHARHDATAEMLPPA